MFTDNFGEIAKFTSDSTVNVDDNKANGQTAPTRDDILIAETKERENAHTDQESFGENAKNETEDTATVMETAGAIKSIISNDAEIANDSATDIGQVLKSNTFNGDTGSFKSVTVQEHVDNIGSKGEQSNEDTTDSVVIDIHELQMPNRNHILGDYELHPFAQAKPAMPAEQKEMLRKDILVNGQHLPIYMTNDKKVLDGWEKLIICLEEGIEPKIKIYDGPIERIPMFISSMNDLRKHRSKSVRGCQVAMLLNEYRRLKSIHIPLGKTKEDVIRLMGMEGIIDPSKMRESLAKYCNVSDNYAGTADKLLREHKDIFLLVAQEAPIDSLNAKDGEDGIWDISYAKSVIEGKNYKSSKPRLNKPQSEDVSAIVIQPTEKKDDQEERTFQLDVEKKVIYVPYKPAEALFEKISKLPEDVRNKVYDKIINMLDKVFIKLEPQDNPDQE